MLEQAYKLAFHASPVAGILTDATGKILLANTNSGNLLKCIPELLIGRQIDKIISGTAQTLVEESHECQVTCLDGSEFPAEIKTVAFETDGDTVIFRTITDITETRKLIASLKERVKEQQTILRVTEMLFKAESPEQMFSESLDFIREGWQYPDHTQVHIKLDNGSEFFTDHFKPTQWGMRSEIQLNDMPYGFIEVYYDTKHRV